MADGKKPHPLAGTVVLPDELDPASHREKKLSAAQKKTTLPIPEDVVAKLREQQATPFPGQAPPGAAPPGTPPSPRQAEQASANFQRLVHSPQAPSFDPHDLEGTWAMTDGATPSPTAEDDALLALGAQHQATPQGDLSLDGTLAVHGQPSQMSSPFHIAGPDDAATTAAPIPGAPWAGAKAREEEARRAGEEAAAKRQAEAREAQHAREAEAQAAREAAAQAEQERLAAEVRRREEAEAFRREQEAAKEAERQRKEARKEERTKKAAALRKGMYGGFGPKR